MSCVAQSKVAEHGPYLQYQQFDGATPSTRCRGEGNETQCCQRGLQDGEVYKRNLRQSATIMES
jgi:hypothetical protein